MASPLTSWTAANRSAFIKGEVVDAISNRTPFFAAMKRLGNIKYNQGGLTIRPPGVRYRDHTIVDYDGRTIVGGYEPDLYSYAEHSTVGLYNLYFDNIFEGLENQGPEALFDKAKEDQKALKQAWTNKFETILFANGASATPVALSGLESFMKITGTYGTLSQAAQDANSLYWWAPTIINGSNALTPRTFKTDPKAYLKNFANTCGNRGASNSLTNEPGPDFGITTQTIHEHIQSYYEEKTRMPMTVSTDTVGMNTRMIKAEGMDIYWSNQCTASTFYGLSMGEFTLYVRTPELFGTRECPVLEPMCTGFQSYFSGQLVTNKPRAHGKITTITV